MTSRRGKKKKQEPTKILLATFDVPAGEYDIEIDETVGSITLMPKSLSHPPTSQKVYLYSDV